MSTRRRFTMASLHAQSPFTMTSPYSSQPICAYSNAKFYFGSFDVQDISCKVCRSLMYCSLGTRMIQHGFCSIVAINKATFGVVLRVMASNSTVRVRPGVQPCTRKILCFPLVYNISSNMAKVITSRGRWDPWIIRRRIQSPTKFGCIWSTKLVQKCIVNAIRRSQHSIQKFRMVRQTASPRGSNFYPHSNDTFRRSSYVQAKLLSPLFSNSRNEFKP